MAHCKDCLHFKVCEAFGKTVKFPVDDGVCLYFTKDICVLTHADRIRAMSDELLATQLVQVFREGIKVMTDVDIPDELLNQVRAHFLEKLKQPAEVKDG